MTYLAPAAPLRILDPHTGEHREHALAVINERDSQKVKGVAGPDQHPKEKGGSDWTIKPGQTGNERRVRARATRVELVRAMTSRWSGDAHALCYWLRAGGFPIDHSPRLNKTDGGAEWVESRGYTLAFDVGLIDLDNPLEPNTKPAKKMPNTLESIEHWKHQFARPELASFGKFITKNGCRLVAPFATACFDRHDFEGKVRAVTAYVNAVGWTSFGQTIQVDAACSDFSRLFRLPNNVRAGTSARYESPWLDLSTMAPRDWEPIDEPASPLDPRSRVRRPRPPIPERYIDRIDGALERLVPAVSLDTFSALAPGATRHDALASSAAALLAKGVAPDAVPAIIVEMARRMGVDAKHIADDRAFAERTVILWCRHREAKLTGASWLYRNCPPLAQAIDDLSLGPAADKLAEVASQRVPLLTADAIYQVIVRDTRAAFDGDQVTVMSHPCGSGKTDAATELALETSAGLHPAGRSGKTAELAARTAYVAPAQRNARDYQRRAWEKRRLPILRLTSPLSERYEANDDGPEGEFVCRIHPEVSALCAGGQNAKRQFCDGAVTGQPCQYRATCRAATGAVDHMNRPVELPDGWHKDHPHICLTHARLGVALEHVGHHGKLICDERPELVTVFTLDETKLKATKKALPSFVDDYADRMRPVLDALLGLLHNLEPYDPAELQAALGADVVADAQAAQSASKDRSGAPPLRTTSVAVARGSARSAELLGSASEVLFTVWKLLQASSPPTTARVVLNQQSERQLHLAWTDPHVAALLLRTDGATVVYDADAHLWEPEYRALIRADHPPIVPTYASDGALVERCLVLSRLASKSKITNKGLFEPGRDHIELVRLAVIRAREAHAQAGVLVTWKPLALLLRGALGEDVTREWHVIEQDKFYLAPLIQELRPVIAELPWKATPLDVLHYGATRGNDEHRDKPFIATIGDPIPNIHAVNTQAIRLGVSNDTLGVRQARAELGQAQERIRTKRRRTPALGVHVGRGTFGEDQQPIYPDGWEGTRFEVRTAPGGDSLKSRIACALRGSPANGNAVKEAG